MTRRDAHGKRTLTTPPVFWYNETRAAGGLRFMPELRQ